MKEYVKPWCIRESNPDHVIFQVRTSDIPTSKDPLATVQSTVDLAKNIMTLQYQTFFHRMISEITRFER